ncbi:GMC family oxidoreductase N-terminal domain-containing protein [Alcanivorax sp. 1008]|uniref:GMC family oxidoreductase N-terminal domain-containing protein n=1 Tax=Alcanivorax sp. 1008 TaxID=2816853 RepID=UPI001D4DE435|nr:GMC family oxidoreductase N-terminal domain-containing protein [Alcanivorax sp. 1008]MCC1497509.1 GMC family oxidoreductase N-terminal domain-containing protein [Alcanivorax sp. 1008]
MTEALTDILPDLPRPDTARALVRAMLPAGEQLPAADAERICATVAGYLKGRPGFRRLLASSLLWLESRSLFSHGKRFSRLTPDQQKVVLKDLSGTLISGHLLRALAAPFKAAWLLDDDTQRRVGSRPPVQVPKQIEAFRWQAQVSPARDMEEDMELEADVVVIGTGAGGAAAAYELASRGLAVVMIEEGEYYNRTHFNGNLTDAVAKLYRGLGATTALGNVTIPVPIGRSVGGTTTINSGTCLRTPDAVLARWQKEFGLTELTSENLDPFFASVEEVINVTPAEDKYVGEIGNVIADGARKIGLTKLHNLPRNAKGCDGQGLCQFGCPTDAKQSTNVSYVPRALDRGAFLFTGFRAEKLLHRQQQLEGVEATGKRDDGSIVRLTVRAAKVIVAMGSLLTPLFLKQNGVRNPHLGRHLTIHPAGVVNAIFPEREFANSQTIPQGFGVGDFAEQGLMFEGGTIPFAGHGLFSNLYGRDFVDFCERYQNTAYFGFMIRDTSEGRVRRGPHRDVPWISYQMNDQDFRLFLKGVETLAQIYLAAGAREVMIPGLNRLITVRNEQELASFMARKHKPKDFLMSAYHPLGTARIAADVSRGVCGPDHQVFGWNGLYVMDGSNVPTSLGANPQVTIMALAARAASKIADSLS